MLVLLMGLSAGGAAAESRVPIGELAAKARERGRVRVIVQLDVPAATRSDSGGPSAAVGRAAIASSRAAVERRMPTAGWTTTRVFESVPLMAVEVTPEALAAIGAAPDVRGVYEDRLERPLLPESAPLVQADGAWSAGYDGTGWTIAILDTGVDANHPFLAGKVVAEACFSGNGSCPNGTTTQYGAGAAAPCDYAEGTCYHGTHVAGIAAGRGANFSGIARGANVIAVQVFSRFTGQNCEGDREDPCARSYISDTIAALEYVHSLRATHRIASVNMSLGGGRFYTQESCDLDGAPRKQVIDDLRAAGIATVAAAGNDSYSDSLNTPACLSNVVSVGATTRQDTIASFSDSAPFLSLLAPGTQILSSVPPDEFARVSGTSQATPHVAGAFAVLDQLMNEGAVDVALNALVQTGLPVFDSRNGLTKPRIRILDALNALPQSGLPSGLQITPDGKRTLISKDVGGERFAITSNDGTATVTGNVFAPDGSEPQFLYCQRVSTDGNPDPYAEEITFSCSSATNCDSLSCPTNQWSFASVVTLPGSFFLPPNGTTSGASSAIGSDPASDTPSALQITPDSIRTLVSKDVDGERWAITLNHDDHSVTGNVYSPGGGDPQFLWCEFQSDDGNPDPYHVLETYGCWVAGRCTTPTCSPDEWSFHSEVTLPGSFFLPR